LTDVRRLVTMVASINAGLKEAHMSPTFIALALLSLVLLVYWRLVLLVAAACLIALVMLGLGVVGNAADVPAATDAQTLAPAEPGHALPEESGPSGPR
jgi:hypothetical protein